MELSQNVQMFVTLLWPQALIIVRISLVSCTTDWTLAVLSAHSLYLYFLVSMLSSQSLAMGHTFLPYEKSLHFVWRNILQLHTVLAALSYKAQCECLNTQQ